MALTEAQQQKLDAWMVSKNVRTQCPACGHEGWAAGDIVRPAVYVAGGTSIQGSAHAIAQLICTNCAYVMGFSAAQAGLLT